MHANKQPPAPTPAELQASRLYVLASNPNIDGDELRDAADLLRKLEHDVKEANSRRDETYKANKGLADQSVGALVEVEKLKEEIKAMHRELDVAVQFKGMAECLAFDLMKQRDELRKENEHLHKIATDLEGDVKDCENRYEDKCRALATALAELATLKEAAK